MATIIPRNRKDGSTGYTARLRIKRDKNIVHEETQTFDSRSDAMKWSRRREAELQRPGGLEAVKRVDPTLREVLQQYQDETKSNIGRTKMQVLRTIGDSDLAHLPCSKIDSIAIVAYAKSLSVSSATRATYLSTLKSIFVIARPAWGYPLELEAMTNAVTVASRLGLIGKSKRRDRRPTLAELDKLMTFFSDGVRRRVTSAPMAHILAYAIFSARRQEEITTITWSDYQPEHARQLVRNMKDPSVKIGNHVWCVLTPEAIRLTEAMPRIADRIFPYGVDGISAAFTRACKLLGIIDLHFHDLRHEAASRLFEMGWTIPQATEVTGHRSWASLQRYSHIRGVGDKFENWPWLERLTSG